MSGFSLLHPHLQHALVHDLGWRTLRPVQDQTIEAILDGCNAVVLAPTAGGKTEAAIFPLLSRILSEDLQPVCALYICPIRALLNNQEERLRAYASMVGLRVFKWHGDVHESQRKRFRAEPAHLLMTTPESLEVMLMSSRTDTRALFSQLSLVIIDEVHAFAGDDRGAHLASLLERLSRQTGRDIQRVGLSATVGNPHVIGQWLQGASQRPFRLVDPPRPAIPRALHVELYLDIEDATPAIARQARGKKSLVFVESRSRAEKVAHALAGTGAEVFVHHSAISRADRTLAEEQFARGQNTAIVCTSTMELGIDVGDLDQVIQVDAPTSVASFLQRLGRTGRRAGTQPNCTFYCLKSETMLQALALLRLAESGWVEDVRPPQHAMHVLAHQVMALILQEGGLSRYRLMQWLQRAWPFASIGDDDVHALLDTMVARDILHESGGLLLFGTQGETLYGRRNFFELYAVFTSPPMLRVMHGREEVGHVQGQFLLLQERTAGPLCFRLAGRAWEVTLLQSNKGLLHVQPAPAGRIPTWQGMPGMLSFALCQEMKRLLLHPGPEHAWLGEAAAEELAVMRHAYAGLLEADDAPLEDTREGVQWHTFAGGAINRLLAVALEHLTGAHWTSGNLSLKCKDLLRHTAAAALPKLRTIAWETLAHNAVHDMARGEVSKFQPCLPEDAETRLLVDRLLDIEGTRRFVGGMGG